MGPAMLKDRFRREDAMAGETGSTFQKETKYYRDLPKRPSFSEREMPDQYKTYPDRPSIALPKVKTLSGISLDEVLKRRKSVRLFSSKALLLEHLSHILWAVSGITREAAGYEFRSVPSAGALYPVETYLAINSVHDVKSGIYHYGVQKHHLELLREGDFGGQVADAALGDSMCREAAAVVIWTAVFARATWKYAERAYRYIYLDAGHMGQNLALMATGLGLGSCPVGAFYDDEVNRLLGVDGEDESAVYMSVLGVPG